MDLIDLLAEFCSLNGPSGFEGSVAKHMVEHLQPLVDEAYIDRFGNAIGIRRCGTKGANCLLLDAHLDEIGLLVTQVKDGFLRFRCIGGVDARILPDLNVRILSSPPLPGVITCLPPHLQDAAAQNKAIPLEELWIDTGLAPAEAARRIPIGTPVLFDSRFTQLQNACCMGKAMDDRAGLAVLLRTAELIAEEPLDVDLIFMGSTREEIGGAGAAVGTYALQPNFCIAVDVTHGRTPDAPKDDTFLLGEGPAIGIGPNINRWMSDRLIRNAESFGLPYQLEILGGHSGTNAWPMQISREGVATAVLSIPLRYMHTPNELLNCVDLETTSKLLSSFIHELSEERRWS